MLFAVPYYTDYNHNIIADTNNPQQRSITEHQELRGQMESLRVPRLAAKSQEPVFEA